MSFLVPWRLLLPEEAYGPMQKAGESFGHIARVSGARIDVTPEVPVSRELGSAVVVLHGTMWQKRTAGRALVDWMFELLGVDRTNWWKFIREVSIVLPGAALGTVAREDTAETVRVVGAKMFVEAPGGPASSFAVRLQGHAQQVISAATRLHAAVQDLVDRGGAEPSDFHCAGDPPPPSLAESVRAARLAPAAGSAMQPPHEHPPLRPPCVPSEATAVQSHLRLLLPGAAVWGVLVPRGHLAEVARACGVRIDIDGSQDCGHASVALTGSVVANAWAVLQLQWRMMQCS